MKHLSLKSFSLILVIASSSVILLVGLISIVASQGLILQNLPAFLGEWAVWIAWSLAIALIGGIQVAECRPIYLRHLHTNAKDLHHQASNPGNASPDLKNLLTQLGEELNINRPKLLWAKAIAVAATIVDVIWSCLVFPPFKVGNDPAAIWGALLRSGLGAVDWFHILMILGNVALIPICYLILLNEWSILRSGKRDVSHAR